ncbi:hypothetical protein SERLA73DRAFT_143666 [Serpula lacrymans var. lacrymans S7.3]|uniref:Uncharacterized protein n=1 Tax=Serpula lacrymans var. lacrymans (strain S7.3) TaxID=936435 RepID=F8QAL4_SERL3|nr:hypothetical protein SERLA73DRAFT_143666 [Serpula lacrymans var. lacrymans S7.3]
MNHLSFTVFFPPCSFAKDRVKSRKIRHSLVKEVGEIGGTTLYRFLALFLPGGSQGIRSMYAFITGPICI